MRFTKRISYLAFLFFSLHAVAQVSPTISPNVMNAAGGHRAIGTSGYWLTDNVGEPFTATLGNSGLNFMITQGFIQPEIVTPGGFSITSLHQDIQCLDKADDSYIALTLTTSVTNYKVKYLWSPASVCPDNNCNRIDTLKAGPYSVKVAIDFTTNAGVAKVDTINLSFNIRNATQPCIIKPFSGVSPNSDGNNDFFTIENIKEFPKNHVSIFNRWGNLLFDVDGYDTTKEDKRWPNADALEKLPSSTYFYIIQLNDGASSVIKGWVELIKN